MKFLPVLALALSAEAVTKVKDWKQLTKAVEAGEDVSLTWYIDLRGHDPVHVYSKVTVDGADPRVTNGFTIDAAESAFIVADGGELILRNLNLDGKRRSKLRGSSEGCVRVEAGGSFHAENVGFYDCVNKKGAGGAIAAEAGADRVVVKRSSFVGNKAESGGGISSQAASLSVEDCNFTGGNYADGGHGSSMEATGFGTDVSITGCFFSGPEKARSGLYFSGPKKLIFDDNTVDGHGAHSAGVVVVARTTKVEFRNSLFQSNTARAIRAFQLFEGSFDVKNCLFQYNAAGGKGDSARGGGAIFIKEASHAAVTIADSTFKENTAAASDFAQGGALHLNAASVVVKDCTFKKNSADEGGAVYVAAAVKRVKISGSDFTGNTAATAGGAIAVVATSSDDTFPGSLVLEDVTASKNTAGAEGDKSGGAFLKMNGGDLKIKNSELDDVGLRYVKASLYDVEANVALADNARVAVFCANDGKVETYPVGAEGDDVEIDGEFPGTSQFGVFEVTETTECPLR